jgi:hypothetical protein
VATAMNQPLDDDSGFKGYHLMLPREQHRRLRLVCTTLAVPMSEFIRDAIAREVERHFTKLGLDSVPIPRRPYRKRRGVRRAGPTAGAAK